jgi:hypothetical protein
MYQATAKWCEPPALLAEKIRKQQFKTGSLPGRPATDPDVWAAVLAV